MKMNENLRQLTLPGGAGVQVDSHLPADPLVKDADAYLGLMNKPAVYGGSVVKPTQAIIDSYMERMGYEDE